MPQDLIYRKAFPGPALSARIIGPVTMENLNFEKKVHDIVESEVEDYYLDKYGKPMIINDKGEQEPFQVFAAIGENVLDKKVTGLVAGKRIYKKPICEKGEWDFDELFRKAMKLEEHARIFYYLTNNPNGKYDVVIRSVNSKDARTADVTHLPFDLISKLKRLILDVQGTKNIYFDVTPKPPGTIEYV